MQITNSAGGRERPCTLAAYADTVWLWPGVPLTEKRGRTVRPLPSGCVRFWIGRLHGFEAQHAPIESALAQAADHLSAGRQAEAQAALDAAKLDRLSPEGEVLMRALAARLGVAASDMSVGTRSLPWGVGNLAADLRLFDAFAGCAAALEKIWDDSKHPRWPRGDPDSRGGRFSPSDGEVAASSARQPPPGIGHNGGPPLDEPPEIPETAPSTAKLRNIAIKSIARWALKRGFEALIPGIGEALAFLDTARWIYDNLPDINAYLDKPRSLQDLRDAVDQPKEGYEVHHIVEQNPARREGFPENQIESRDNKVRISKLKHWEISGWYGTRNEEFNGASPRDYLRGKDWQEKQRVGMMALVKFGVLRP